MARLGRSFPNQGGSEGILPSPVVAADVNVLLSTIAVPALVFAVTVTGDSEVTPDEVGAVASVPLADASGGTLAEVGLLVVAAVASIPSVTVSQINDANPTPATVAAVASVPLPLVTILPGGIHKGTIAMRVVAQGRINHRVR